MIAETYLVRSLWWCHFQIHDETMGFLAKERHTFKWVKIFKNGPSKICIYKIWSDIVRPHLFTSLLFFSTNFTWFILEYLDPNVLDNLWIYDKKTTNLWQIWKKTCLFFDLLRSRKCCFFHKKKRNRVKKASLCLKCVFLLLSSDVLIY